MKKTKDLYILANSLYSSLEDRGIAADLTDTGTAAVITIPYGQTVSKAAVSDLIQQIR